VPNEIQNSKIKPIDLDSTHMTTDIKQQHKLKPYNAEQRNNDERSIEPYSLSDRSSCGAVWLAAAPYVEEKGAVSSDSLGLGTEIRPLLPVWYALAAGKNSISLTSFFAGASASAGPCFLSRAKNASPCAVRASQHL